jgi:PAS domain S-box-containing protein
MEWPLLSNPPAFGRHVLVVDDDRDFAGSLRNLLRLEGYEVEIAYNLAGALDALDRFKVEVALIDIRLGDQDGLALLREFRQRREDVICVIMTAYASVETAIEALQRGAYDFLCKPFYPEDVVATLERCFERLALARGREAAERALSRRNQELEAVNARLKRAVSAMHMISTSETLSSLHTTAIEAIAHVVGAKNAALYLAQGSELALHEALLAGLPSRIMFPGDARTFQRPMFTIHIASAQAASPSAGAPASSASLALSLLAFPLTGEMRQPLGLLVLQRDPNADFSDQDRELAIILTSFINEAIRLLHAHDSARWCETRLREFIDHSPSLISLNDLQGRYLLVNRQFETWHGRCADEAIGRTPDELFSLNVAQLYRSASASPLNDTIVEGEAELVFQDGSAHTVLVTRFPIRGTGGRPIGIGTIATDVTESRLAEKRLRHSEKLEALGQLTGGIAHDFNNLLAVIIGNLDLLRDKVCDPDENRELIDDSLQSASSGRELVQSLLAFGRSQGPQPAPTDPNGVVLGFSRVLKRTLGEAIEIHWCLSREVWLIAVDKCQLETVLLNLVLNARDALPQGGVLTVETRNVVFPYAIGEPEAIVPGSYVALAVTDNGIGMTPVVAARALQPFFTTKKPGIGNGLGLNMVHRFVKESGGHLVIDSKPGIGTSVTLYLPVAKDNPERPQRAYGDKVEPRVQSERILVVDQKMVPKMT